MEPVKQGSFLKSLRLFHEGSRVQATLTMEGISPTNYEINLSGNVLQVSVLSKKDRRGIATIHTESIVIPGIQKAYVLTDYVKDGQLHIEMIKGSIKELVGKNPMDQREQQPYRKQSGASA